MRTYSHFITTAAVSKGFDIGVNNRRALLLGAVFPDLPLTVLTLGYFVRRKLRNLGRSSATGRDFRDIRCTDPMWVVSYNFFHAPLILAPLIGIGYILKRKYSVLGQFLIWFALGCGFHSIIDMVTHHDDGPLVLFPLNWQRRINSPISYWDKRHHGQIVTGLEHFIDILLMNYLASK